MSATELQRPWLVVTTALAVISDAMLLPFYPRLFADSFGIHDPQHVGAFLAATCLVALLALPAWAAAGRHVSTLRLLVIGQAGAGILSFACLQATTTSVFWALALTMVACKASYLLVYPYLMRLVPESDHPATVAMLTVLVHLGGIAGAALGGWLLLSHAPLDLYAVMGAADLFQMAGCAWLVLRGAREPASEQTDPAAEQHAWIASRRALGGLGLVMLFFYFSCFVARPFFEPWWVELSGIDSALVSGLVFAIPAGASLLALGAQRAGVRLPTSLLPMLGLGVVGLALQAVPVVPLHLVGRALYGFAVFVAMVQLDLRMFAVCRPEAYARAFARMNVAQQLGVLVSFYGAGAAVAGGGLALPFWIAIVGFAVTGVVHHLVALRAAPLEEAPA